MMPRWKTSPPEFPRLRAGTFIEARLHVALNLKGDDFPAFGRGLSLRLAGGLVPYLRCWYFSTFG